MSSNRHGFALWLNREEWGAVIDGLMLERERSLQRKASNSESTSHVKAAMCVDVLRTIRVAALAPLDEMPE